jgi:hypothetical protein
LTSIAIAFNSAVVTAVEGKEELCGEAGRGVVAGVVGAAACKGDDGHVWDRESRDDERE